MITCIIVVSIVVIDECFACVEEHSAWNNLITQEVTDLVVIGQCLLRLIILYIINYITLTPQGPHHPLHLTYVHSTYCWQERERWEILNNQAQVAQILKGQR